LYLVRNQTFTIIIQLITELLWWISAVYNLYKENNIDLPFDYTKDNNTWDTLVLLYNKHLLFLFTKNKLF